MKKSISSEAIKEPLFAAANSGEGFISFYSDIFGRESIRKKYIIKGGPGTGKSSFMGKVAAYATSQGAIVEYYRCSSDPESIDGIVINQEIAVIDGTAPHSEDTELPGARDEIINLGMFWDSEKLETHFKEIDLLSEKKSEYYKKAYRYLSACLELERINLTLLAPSILLEKIKRSANKIVSKIPKGEDGRVLAGLEGSIGMKGTFRMNSYLREASAIYIVEDIYNSASVFLSEIISYGLHNGNTMRVSYDHVSAGRPDAVYFTESKIGFVLDKNLVETNQKILGKINMKRFIDNTAFNQTKSEIKSNMKIFNALIGATSESMKKAGEYHFQLENIYKSCMDFDSQNAFCTEFCEGLKKYI